MRLQTNEIKSFDNQLDKKRQRDGRSIHQIVSSDQGCEGKNYSG